LTGLGFIAKSGGDIGYSDRGIVEAALKANRAERRKTMLFELFVQSELCATKVSG
jgi:hypothetical protein